MSEFRLPFDLDWYQKLDEFALLARQDYNLGKTGDWFGCFRGGLYGFYARIYGVALHYYDVHSWKAAKTRENHTEYHLSSIFFHMDSAIECFVFAINALGYAVDSSKFCDVTEEKGLKQVAQWNILGSSSRQPLDGYARLFPNLQSHWIEKRAILNTVTEQHDVSKHRSQMFVGGKGRLDPPPGFFEALGITDGAKFPFRPMQEIVLQPRPKTPRSKAIQVGRYDQLDTLEDLCEQFCEFMNVTGEKTYRDAVDTIKLPHNHFLEQVTIVHRSDIDLYEDEACMRKRQDVVGLMLSTGPVGYGVTSIAPTTKRGHYVAGKKIRRDSVLTNRANVWGDTWYVDPDDGKKKHAWQSAAEYVGEQLTS